MESLKLPTGNIPEIYSEICATNTVYLGFALVILMRYLDLKKNRDGWIGLKDRCKGFGMHWIIMLLKILVLMASLLPGAIEDWVSIMFGSD